MSEQDAAMRQPTQCGSSPLAGWMGGKFYLSKKIAGMLPEHKCYCEPFAGAAWVLFRKPESKVETLNDINREIVTFYRVIQNHLEEFIRYFKWVWFRVTSLTGSSD